MIRKSLAMVAVLLSIVLVPAVMAAQAGIQTSTTHAAAPASAAPATSATPMTTVPNAATTPGATNPALRNDCEGGACDAPMPHITIATAAPAPAPWPLQDRIAWAASLLLTIMAYVGIMLGLSTLRKIERQTRYAESAAQAATDSAKAALLLAENQAQQAQVQMEAERSWILVTTEPAAGVLNSFTVVATNRGRSPAQVVSLAEENITAADESQLPAPPKFQNEPHPPVVPIILLPGESIGIKTFSRDDVNSVCDTAEKLRRVEDWEERIYFYGTVAYEDLRSSGEKPVHETAWCCWYIHGRQKSGMVMAGGPGYNRHS